MCSHALSSSLRVRERRRRRRKAAWRNGHGHVLKGGGSQPRRGNGMEVVGRRYALVGMMPAKSAFGALVLSSGARLQVFELLEMRAKAPCQFLWKVSEVPSGAWPVKRAPSVVGARQRISIGMRHAKPTHHQPSSAARPVPVPVPVPRPSPVPVPSFFLLPCSFLVPPSPSHLPSRVERERYRRDRREESERRDE